MAGKVPPQFLPGYIKKAGPPTVKAPTGPPKSMPKSAAPSLAMVLTENGVPAKKAGQIAKGVKTGTIKP